MRPGQARRCLRGAASPPPLHAGLKRLAPLLPSPRWPQVPPTDIVHELGPLYPLALSLRSSSLKYPNHSPFFFFFSNASTCTHAHRKVRGSLGHHSSDTIHPPFLPPSLAWNLPSKLGLLASELQELAPPLVESQAHATPPSPFHKGSEN